jgi:hypothetical protein
MQAYYPILGMSQANIETSEIQKPNNEIFFEVEKETTGFNLYWYLPRQDRFFSTVLGEWLSS